MSRSEGDPSLLLPNAPEFSAQEVARILDAGDPLQIMDVRAPERVARGRIDLVPPGRFHNIRGSELIHYKDPADTGLDLALPTALICGRGQDSKILAAHLGRLGFDARSLNGGMAAWMRITLHRALDPPQGLDHLIQFDDEIFVDPLA